MQLSCHQENVLFRGVTNSFSCRLVFGLVANKDVELWILCICMQDMVDFLQQAAVFTDVLSLNAQGHKVIQLVESIIRPLSIY